MLRLDPTMFKNDKKEEDMSLTQKYQGNVVDAVQLTRENAQEVAEWVGGEVTTFVAVTDVDAVDGGKMPVEVEKLRVNITPHRPGAWRFGQPGDWFVKDGNGLVRIFPKKTFLKIFSPCDQDSSQ
mgnify:CR=1 FL=1